MDTNVLMNYFLGKEPMATDCRRIIDASAEAPHALYVSSLSMKDLGYLLGMSLKRMERLEKGSVSPASAAAASEISWACLKHVLGFAQIVPVGGNECLDSFTYRPLHDDFEDDLLVAAAIASGADFLVTEDTRLRAHAPIACLSTADMAILLEAELASRV